MPTRRTSSPASPKPVGATGASGAARDAFAAGAARAGGERARRTRTPLLPSLPSAPASEAASTMLPLNPASEVAASRDRPRRSRGPGRSTVSAAGKTGSEQVQEQVPAEVSEEVPGTATAGKHRPRPAPGASVPPSRGALTRSGTRAAGASARPSRSGGGSAARAAGRAAVRATGRGRRLRAVPDLASAPEVTETETTGIPGTAPAEEPRDLPTAGGDRRVAVPAPSADGSATPSPRGARRSSERSTPTTSTTSDEGAAERAQVAAEARTPATSVVRPGLEDLLQAGVAALRAVVAATGVSPEEVETQVAGLIAFLRRRLAGDYTVDEFGFDGDFTDNVYLPLLRPFYRQWFRTEVRGLENIPTTGGALVVANHSGTLAMDSLMTQVAVHDEHPAHRHLRMLGADLVFQTPLIGQLARSSGSTLATNADAERLLGAGELVGVWPEGFKGVGKPFTERYKLQRFGRGGFVSAAIGSGVPIVPCSIVGAEEIYPIIGNMKTLARLLGTPYAPITPTWPLLGPLGLIPLPSKWIIEFGVPVQTAHLGASAADDPMLVFDLTDQIRETIQQTLYSLLMQRRSVFF